MYEIHNIYNFALSLLRNKNVPPALFYLSVIMIAALSVSGTPNAYVQD